MSGVALRHLVYRNGLMTCSIGLVLSNHDSLRELELIRLPRDKLQQQSLLKSLNGLTLPLLRFLKTGSEWFFRWVAERAPLLRTVTFVMGNVSANTYEGSSQPIQSVRKVTFSSCKAGFVWNMLRVCPMIAEIEVDAVWWQDEDEELSPRSLPNLAVATITRGHDHSRIAKGFVEALTVAAPGALYVQPGVRFK
jgi:hypothetical protein